MIPSSSRSDSALLALALALGLVPAGCGGAGGPGFVTTAELPSQPRRPDGVAVDPTSAPPRPRDAASADAGLVTLRTPLGAEHVHAAVAEFFRAIVQEDSEALSQLFTRDALAINTGSGSYGGSPSASLFWSQRFRRLDYTKLAGEVVYREAELSVFRAEDALTTSPHPAIRADALSAGDVVVHAPIAASRSGTDRLLGDEIVLWLRRDGGRFRIYRLVEEFQLP